MTIVHVLWISSQMLGLTTITLLLSPVIFLPVTVIANMEIWKCFSMVVPDYYAYSLNGHCSVLYLDLTNV